VLLDLAARPGGSTVDEVLDLSRQRDGSLEALVELVDVALVVIERLAMDQAVYRVPAPLRWLLVGADVRGAEVRGAEAPTRVERPRAVLAAGLADRLVHPVNLESPRLRAVA
jgi:hypothetical protein